MFMHVYHPKYLQFYFEKFHYSEAANEAQLPHAAWHTVGNISAVMFSCGVLTGIHLLDMTK